MATYKVKCPTCGKLFEAKRKDKNFCSRLCYRNSPKAKAEYRVRTDANREKNKYESKWRFGRLKYSCNSRGLRLGITFDEYEVLINKKCHYCNNELLKATGSSLDRIDNKRGYELDNVLPCCGKCNQIRNVHLTKEEMEVAMKAVLKYREGFNDNQEESRKEKGSKESYKENSEKNNKGNANR